MSDLPRSHVRTHQEDVDYKRNPHYSPHWGDTVDCYTCHKEHKASEISCATQYCHVKNFEGVQLK